MVFRNSEIDTEFFTPRAYQQELLDKAKKKNIIVPLGTGSGKTFIAVMLIKELAAKLRPDFDQGGQRAFFLVDKVALVKQQATQIRDQSNLEVREYHGHKNPDIWNQERWVNEIKECHVMVMTAQIFWDLLNHGFFTLERACLLIFDECHHATKGHPYRQIMEHYRLTKKEKRPKILGLTASVITSNIKPNMLERLMRELENALDSSIETASDLVSVAKYGAKPQIKVLLCEDYDSAKNSLCLPVRTMLEGALNFSKSTDYHPDLDLDPTKPVNEAFQRTLAILNQLGPWCAWKVCSIWQKQLERLNKYSMTEAQQIFILMGETYIRAAKHQLHASVKDVDSVQELLHYLPHKVSKLLDLLKFLNPKKLGNDKSTENEFSGIIFVEQRYVAYVMKILLKHVQRWDKENYGYLKLDFVIGYSGYNVSPEEEMALHRRQEEVLRKFRQKQLNLLISTSVLEEGVDVRQCNCVIRFDAPKEYRSYIQSKGRARKAGSRFYILIPKEDQIKFTKTLMDYAEIEKILLQHCHSRDNPAAQEFDINEANALMPPYEPVIKTADGKDPPGGKPRVTMSTAIALVNRYCAKLPSDMFTRLVPRCEITEVDENGMKLYMASLTLPINSPVKEIIWAPKAMRNKKYAQMACALKACEVLHKEKELDDHLLPMAKESALRMLNEMEDDGEIWPADGRQRPGSTKRKQYYEKKIAYALTDALPKPNVPSYVHVVNLNLSSVADRITNPKNRKITNPAHSSRQFGFLSAKSLPMVPTFPLYTRQGEVATKLSTLPVQLRLSLDEMQLASDFHHFVFSDILRLEKHSMEYNPEGAINNILVVPLKKEDGCTVLDWNFIKEIIQSLQVPPTVPSEETRKNFVFDPEMFQDAIVMPWYRNIDIPHYYYVADVCRDLSPESQFPDHTYTSFNEYFEKKYKINICNQQQPLLDVDYTSSRLNLLTPRFFNRRGQLLRSLKERPQALDVQRQILVPELVTIHPIPSSMWNMIVLLPSVLYRTNSLLLADELRTQVEVEAMSREAGAVKEGWEWASLDYGWEKNLEAFVGAMGLDTSSSFKVAEGDEWMKRGDGKKNKAEETFEDESEDEGGFRIGVWDPSLAQGLPWNPIISSTFDVGNHWRSGQGREKEERIHK